MFSEAMIVEHMSFPSAVCEISTIEGLETDSMSQGRCIRV